MESNNSTPQTSTDTSHHSLPSLILSKLYSFLPNQDYTRHNPSPSHQDLLRSATTYQEWFKAANALDSINGLEEWQAIHQSADYDWELIQARLSQLEDTRQSNPSISEIIFQLQTNLTRNLGDMSNPKLYSKFLTATKSLIDMYLDEVVLQLNLICDHSVDSDQEPELTFEAKHTFFMNTRQVFGRTAIMLSGGLCHLGVLRCLFKERLLPRIISGTSAGSVVAAVVCTRTDEDLATSFEHIEDYNFEMFEEIEHPDTPLRRLQRLLTKGGLFDAEVLKRSIVDNVGYVTFQEAFNKSHRILNIAVSTNTLHDMPQLLNYLTAPDVCKYKVKAKDSVIKTNSVSRLSSCSVPLVYAPTQLMAKDKNGNTVPWDPSNAKGYMDGTVDNDLPMERLSELFHINHFIVCQVNPHVWPFMSNSHTTQASQITSFCLKIVKNECQHRFTQMKEIGVLPLLFHKLNAVFDQKYTGDITIVPELGKMDFVRVLSNPTAWDLESFILCGERATWPKMEIIKNSLRVELAIDAILYRLRLSKFTGGSQPNDLRDFPSKMDIVDYRAIQTRPGLANHHSKSAQSVRQYSESGDFEQESGGSQTDSELDKDRQDQKLKRKLYMTAGE
ncbi:acyl transferase/acyl hydrolase/lysophospholipase [Phycomyces nitens]|nr:acyl transferase/acyl hydrolase/lysophospholipase [Phycomyces nitens]